VFLSPTSGCTTLAKCPPFPSAEKPPLSTPSKIAIGVVAPLGFLLIVSAAYVAITQRKNNALSDLGKPSPAVNAAI
jgi:hypothetical protein